MSERKSCERKLVRDRIPEYLEGIGVRCEFSVTDKGEYSVLLKAKVREEIDELLEAEARADIVEELADVYEVLKPFAFHKGIAIEEVRSKMDEKEVQRGAFNEGIVFENLINQER